MQIDVQERQQIHILVVRGSLDSLTTTDLATCLTDLIQAGSRQLLLDFGQVDYLSSAALGAIITALKEVRSHGGDMRLAALQPEVMQIFELTGLDEFMEILPNVNEGVTSFGS